jgi:hypothetical protein
VLIDDCDYFVELAKPKSREVEPLVRKAAELGVIFIATTIGSKMRGHDGITGLFKMPQSAIVLGNPDDSVSIVSGIRVSRDYKPLPEIGFWFKRGDVKKIKIPFVE